MRIKSLLLTLIAAALIVLYAVTRPLPVVVIGDSMAARWHTDGMTPIGYPGETSEQILYHILDGQCPPASAYVLLVGINDLDWDVSDTALRDNIAVIVAELRQRGRTVYIGSLLPVGERWARLRPRILETNAWLMAFAAQHPGVVYVDFYAAFEGTADERYFADGLHPNAAGYALMAQTLNAAALALR